MVMYIVGECKIVRLGDVANFIRGVTYKKEDSVLFKTVNTILTADNININNTLSIKELKLIFLKEEIIIPKDKLLNKHDVFICTSSGSKNHIGKVAYINENIGCFAGGFMGILRVKNSIIPKFLYFFLTSKFVKNQIRDISVGANIRNLSSNINNLIVTLPPLETQQKIVEELDNIQKGIDCLNEAIDSLKKQLNLDSFRFAHYFDGDV